MADVDKITLERTEDGEHWRMHAEGDDVEGHMPASNKIEAQPAGPERRSLGCMTTKAPAHAGALELLMQGVASSPSLSS